MRERLRAMDANLLVVLRVLLEERNLTRTGELLLMSRPAVSAALRKLRDHYGDELLVREGRSLALTDLAASLVGPVSEALGAAEDLLTDRRHFDPRTSHTQFSAAMSDYAMAILGGPLLRLFHERAPTCTLQIDFLRAHPDEMERQLLRRDVLIGPLGFGLPGGRDPVFADDLVCVVAAANPDLVDGALSADSLRRMPRAAVVIQWQSTEGTFGLDDTLDAVGVPEDNIVVQVDRLLALPHVVSGSRLCAFMPSWLARRHADALGLVIADTPLERIPVIEAVHWNPRRHDDPALLWLRQVLADASREVMAMLEDEPPAR